MSVIIPEISDDNSISLSFGLKFKLRQIFNNGSKSEVKFIKSPENDTFYGLFDVEDVDFEIVVDNRGNDYSIGFDIIVANRESFYLKSGKYCSLKALETNGKHLHFISQSTEEGKLLVALSAHNNQTTIEEEAINCSRIGFAVEVEKPKPETVVMGPPIKVYIKTLTGKTIGIPIGCDNTIGYLMYRIQDIEGIPPDQQRLIFEEQNLVKEDNKRLSDYNIQNENTILLVLRLCGGGQCKVYTNPQAINANNDSIEEPNVGPSGERGVVCFGRQTDQQFGSAYNGFIASKDFVIKPFTIELRMKPKYSVNQ